LWVQFKRDVSGKPKSVTIDLQQHGKDLQFFFRKNGAFANEDDELVKRVHADIRTLPWKNNFIRQILRRVSY
jgi:hypothetical protein